MGGWGRLRALVRMLTQLRIPGLDLDAIVERRARPGSKLLDAARSYIAARRTLEGADPGAMLDAIRDVDWAWHGLLLAAGEPCDCEPGTCPT